MSEFNMTVPRPTSRWKGLGLLALGLIAGIGGTLVLRPSHADHAKAEAGAQATRKQMYQCPMHPQIMQDRPGDCPICGMALVPME